MKILCAFTVWETQMWKAVTLSDCTLGEKDAWMQDGVRIRSHASVSLLISYATWVRCDCGYNFHRLYLKNTENFESYIRRLESCLLCFSENFMNFVTALELCIPSWKYQVKQIVFAKNVIKFLNLLPHDILETKSWNGFKKTVNKSIEGQYFGGYHISCPDALSTQAPCQKLQEDVNGRNSLDFLFWASLLSIHYWPLADRRSKTNKIS